MPVVLRDYPQILSFVVLKFLFYLSRPPCLPYPVGLLSSPRILGWLSLLSAGIPGMCPVPSHALLSPRHVLQSLSLIMFLLLEGKQWAHHSVQAPLELPLVLEQRFWLTSSP